jgi:hypothetical protein
VTKQGAQNMGLDSPSFINPQNFAKTGFELVLNYLRRVAVMDFEAVIDHVSQQAVRRSLQLCQRPAFVITHSFR